jgi:hypothetical protein
MGFDDQRDDMTQDIPAGQFLTADPGPSIYRATVFGKRIHRYMLYIVLDIVTIIVLQFLHYIVPNIVYDI